MKMDLANYVTKKSTLYQKSRFQNLIWKLLFRKITVKGVDYIEGGRCTICDGGNKKKCGGLTCMNGFRCPCKMNQYLKFRWYE